MNFFLARASDYAARHQFGPIMPEVIVSVAGVLVMLVDAFTKRANQRWATGGISLAGLVAAAASCVWLWDAAGSAPPRRPSTA